jgi:hypothetical protein
MCKEKRKKFNHCVKLFEKWKNSMCFAEMDALLANYSL